MAEYKLELKGVSKSFPGVKALDNVQLSVRPGTVHALMGENGAGKSTLMKCLFGIYKMDSGEVYLDGQKVDIRCSNGTPGASADPCKNRCGKYVPWTISDEEDRTGQGDRSQKNV